MDDCYWAVWQPKVYDNHAFFQRFATVGLQIHMEMALCDGNWSWIFSTFPWISSEKLPTSECSKWDIIDTYIRAKFQKVWFLRKSSNENGSISFWISEYILLASNGSRPDLKAKVLHAFATQRFSFSPSSKARFGFSTSIPCLRFDDFGYFRFFLFGSRSFGKPFRF